MRLDGDLNEMLSDSGSIEFQWVSDGEGEDESTDQQLSQGPVPPNEDEEEGTGSLAEVVMHAEAERIVQAVRAGVFDVASLQESVTRLAICLEKEAQDNTMEWLRAEEEVRQTTPEYQGMSDMRYAVARGRVDVVKQLYKQGFRAATEDLDLAIDKGFMELAEWLYSIPQRVVPAVSTVMAAVRHSMQEDGSLAILELLAPTLSNPAAIEDGAFTEAFDYAVETQASEALEYLAAAGVRGSASSVGSAVRQGKEDLLLWLLDRLHIAPDDVAMLEAVRCRNESVVSLLDARGCKPMGLTPEDVDGVLESGNLALARWVHEAQEVRGSPSAHAMHRAIQRNDLPLLRLLLDYDYPDQCVETVLAALEEPVKPEMLKELMAHRGPALCETASTILMPWAVGDRVTVTERITGRYLELQSICKHSLFAPLEPGTEAVVVRVSHRHEDFLYDLEWQVPDSGPARVWYLPSSHLSSPLKQVVQRHNHTPFLATMAIRSGLTPSNTDKLLALVDGRPEMLSSEAWRVIMPHLLDKHMPEAAHVAKLQAMLPKDSAALIDLIRNASD